MNSRTEFGWYALRTLHNKASEVCRHASREQVEWYTPLREIEDVVDGRVVRRREQLMPSLVFLRCDQAFIARLKQLTGDNIIPYCKAGTSQPEVITDSEMETFRFIASTAAETLEFVDESELSDNKRVRITGGIFAGCEGYIHRVHGTKRFVVRIEGIAAIATTYIPRQYIEKIE